MRFETILYPTTTDHFAEESVRMPDFFVDLNLDQLVAAVTAAKDEYNLKPFFYVPLHDLDAVAWRQEIMRDLEESRVLESLKKFAESMRAMRKQIAQSQELYYQFQKQRWFVDAVGTYCEAVCCLLRDLSGSELKSRGLLSFRAYLNRYVQSKAFISLADQGKRLVADLEAIRYTLLIRGLDVQVRQHNGEQDYNVEIEGIFRKFKQGATQEYVFKFSDSRDMNQVEAEILKLVARHYPHVFNALENYYTASQNYLDTTIVRFDREIQFYVSYLEHIGKIRAAGLSFCYPRVMQDYKEICSKHGFDLVLAGRLVSEQREVICNDFYLQGRERMIVVSGPNQGGKTTFARTFGQLHYLAALGLLVPGTRAQLPLCDRILTHFERQENINDLRGKLQDDLVRLHRIVEEATPDSIVVMNEIFTSTTLKDAIFLSKKIATRLLAMDVLCVWVTFIDELASLSGQTVSMVSSVLPENPAIRTYKITRRPATGLAYAMAIAEKYGLTYEMIKERTGK